MAVTVFSLGRVANVVATLKAGGSLAANTTYYVRVDPCRYSDLYSGSDLRYPAIWGLPSTEISFTTDTTNKSVDLSWDALANASRYKVYMSTVSGDYYGANKAFYNYSTAGISATTLSITAVPGSTVNAYFNRSWLIKPTNGLPGGVIVEGQRLGIKLVGTCTLADIKTAVDAAGFADHCYHDNQVFVLRGFIYSKTGDGATTLAPRYKDIYLVEGDLASNNASATFSFGVYDTVELVSGQQCTINLMGYTNAFFYWTVGVLNLYCDFRGTYETGGFNSTGYITRKISDISFLGTTVRGFNIFVLTAGSGTLVDFILKNTTGLEVYTSLTNIKVYNGRLVIADPTGLTLKDVSVYQNPATCEYSNCDMQLSNTGNDYEYKVYNFNCLRTNNQPCIYWYITAGGSPIFKAYAQADFTVIDANGNAISGATVTVLNKNNVQEFSATTNASGQFDTEQYMLFQSAVPTTGVTGVATTWTTYSPFVITVSKQGYKTVRITTNIIAKATWTIKLDRSPFVGNNNMSNIWG
jgi:hypothetical protein